MIEIAISLAVIAFALVAIIGVLPRGLEVQKNNREETIINHDSVVWMDAIRSGARGFDDLTNYVIAITNFWTLYDANWQNPRSDTDGYDAFGSAVTSQSVFSKPAPFFPLTNGFRIIGLLTRPKYEVMDVPPYRFQSNYIVAYVRSLSGPATEKFPQADPTVVGKTGDVGLTFAYRMICENTAMIGYDTNAAYVNAESYRLTPWVVMPNYETNSAYARALHANLRELRLTFRWPLLPNWSSGPRVQTYRTLVGGQLFAVNEVGQPLYFFEPTQYGTNMPWYVAP